MNNENARIWLYLITTGGALFGATWLALELAGVA